MRWIPITERRPQRDQCVVYWDISGMKYGGNGFPSVAHEWRDEHHLIHASHWMPLPEPVEAKKGTP